MSPEQLRSLGVLSWRLDADAHRTDPKLRAIREARGYSYEVRRGLPSVLWPAYLQDSKHCEL